MSAVEGREILEIHRRELCQAQHRWEGRRGDMANSVRGGHVPFGDSYMEQLVRVG